MIRGEEMDIDGSNDEPVAFTKLSASTMGPIPIPSSASKHKYSALGKDESTVSSLHTSYSSGKWKPRTTTLDTVKESVDVIGTSLHELASECKLHRLQLDAHADAAHEQEAKQSHHITDTRQCNACSRSRHTWMPLVWWPLPILSRRIQLLRIHICQSSDVILRNWFLSIGHIMCVSISY